MIDQALAEFHGLEPSAAWTAYRRRSRDVAARRGTGTVLVAERGGALLGTVTFYPDARRMGTGLPPGWAGFGALAVMPRARRLGAGAALVEACLARARALRAPALGIHTADAMGPALRLYARAGFRRAALFDLPASRIEGFDPAGGEVMLRALRHDLGLRRPESRT